MIRSPAQQAGAFTLVEMILAITLATGLMGALLGFYNQIAGARRTIRVAAESASIRAHVMDRMTDELRCATVDPVAGVGLRGDNEHIEILWAMLPPANAWTQAVDDGPIPASPGDLKWVTYRQRVDPDAAAENAAEGLQRVCRDSRDEDSSGTEDEAAGDLIAPGIRFVRFRYHDGGSTASEGEFGEIRDADGGWVDVWDRAELPLAVEITLGTEPLAEQMEAEEYLDQFETFRRVVYLPASTIRLAAADLQGAE